MSDQYDFLQNSLVEAASRGGLAPFYILKSRGHDGPSAPLNLFVSGLLRKLHGHELFNETDERVNENEDLMWLTPSGDKGRYLSSDLSLFFRFSHFNPASWPHKFCFFSRAQGLAGSDLQHKLLKTLEEPQQNTTIIFLCNEECHFLDTVTSRAIQMEIPPPTGTAQIESEETRAIDGILEDYVSGKIPFHEALYQLKNESNPESVITRIVNEKLFSEDLLKTNFNYCNSKLDQIQFLNDASAYNNPAQGRISLLLKSLRD